MDVFCNCAESASFGWPQVRVDAVAALRNLVDAFNADDLPSIQPLIPALLNQLFALMAEARAPADSALPLTQHML